MTRNCLKEDSINYDAVEIKQQNIPAHLDIEKDIQEQKDGLFTFILKVANSSIADYNVVEYVTINKYLRLKRIVIEELTFSCDSQLGNRTDSLGTDNG